MKNKILLCMIIALLFVSCKGKPSGTADKAVDSNNPPEISESLFNSDVVYRKGTINADCDYYNNLEPVGRLKQGQNIVILEHYYPSVELNVINVKVEVVTVDDGVKGHVKEKYITYDDELYTAWFKNILFTREYYYTESVEVIYANSGYARDSADSDISKRKGALQLWRHFYSEERLCISENYIVIGNAETTFTYRLESVKKDGNKYTLYLSNLSKEEYEVTLMDNGNSIVMTQCAVKSEDQELDFILYSVNYNYVQCDEEKSKKTKNTVIAWCNEQLEKLEK